MAKVTTLNGESGNSTEGMYFHQYTGKPESQYEFRLGDDVLTVEGLGAVDPHEYVGATFSVNVRVKLGSVKEEEIKNGTREILGLRVVDSGPLRLVERAAKKDSKSESTKTDDDTDPNQATIDDYSEDYGDVPTENSDASGPTLAFSDTNA